MTEVKLEDVDALEQRTAAWLATRTNPDAVDQRVAEDVALARAEHTRNGFTLLSDRTFDEYEDRVRQQFDKDTIAQGVLIERDQAVLAARIQAAKREREPLPGPVGMVAPVPEKELLAGILDELQQARVRTELVGMTRTQVLEALPGWSDEHHGPYVRLVEEAVLTGTLPRIGVRDDDPIKDGIAIPKLKQAVAARRAARVPAYLHEAEKRVGALRSLNFTSVLDHLASGRGVAHRPRSSQKPVAV